MKIWEVKHKLQITMKNIINEINSIMKEAREYIRVRGHDWISTDRFTHIELLRQIAADVGVWMEDDELRHLVADSVGFEHLLAVLEEEGWRQNIPGGVRDGDSEQEGP